jgi:NADPH:quinone reductase-like Zn-dependent oxidoreductase
MPWAMQIAKTGKADVFEKVMLPVRAPGPKEVLIDVRACGVNFADVLMRMGLYPEAPKTPFVPGYEVAGVVAQVGAEVTDYQPGDRVMAATYFGGYATQVCCDEIKVLPLPEHLSFEEGAGLLVNFMTAWVALHEMARIREGDHVLIHGIAGGVGLAALQLAKQAGCVVYGTAGSQAKLDYAKTMGLDYGINYLRQDFVSDVRLNVGRRPLDVVLDPIGGDYIAKNRKLLKPTGKLIVFGMSNAISGEKINILKTLKTAVNMFHISLMSLMGQNQGIFGLNVLRLWEFPIMRSSGQAILKAFEDQQVKCILSDTFPLDQAAEAHRYLQDRRNVGKVVLTVPQE